MIALKRDRALLLLNILCIIGTFLLVYTNRISWAHGEAFILGLVIPSGVTWTTKPTKTPLP